MTTYSYGARKIVVLLALVSIVIFSGARRGVQGQQWTGPDANGNISNTNTGNVGIGTSAPINLLDVGSAAIGTMLGKAIVVSNTTGPSTVAVGQSVTARGRFKWNFNATEANAYLALGVSAGTNPLILQDAGGNVGIGTTTPGNYRLSVNGPLVGTAAYTSYIADGLYGATAVPSRISTYNTNGGILFGYEDLGLGDYSPRIGFQQTYHATYSPNITSTKASIGLVRNGNITIRGGASNTEFLRIDNSGNVGIGTTDPSLGGVVASRFTVVQADASTGFSVGNTAGIPRFAINGNSNGTWTMYDYGAGAWTAGITQKSGSVGIGNVSPGYKLDVNGEINATGIRINGTPISGGGSSQWTGTSSIYYNGGNVGIGTTSPTAKLHVLGSGNIQAIVQSTTAATELDLISNAAGSGSWAVGTGWASGGSVRNLWFYDNVAAATRVAIDSSGNLGVGTTSPQEKLHVAGSIKVDGNINAKYQDVAEWVPTSEQLAAGTVVVLDPTKSNQVISSTIGYDTRVAGVISAQPGITLGEGGEGKVLVATTGRVRVKVDASRAPVQIGDLLVTGDIPGVAMKSEPVNLAGVQIHRPGTIIGKALEPLAKGRGEILVLLSLQ